MEQEAVDGPDQPAVESAVDREDLTEVPDDARTRHRDLSEELDRYAFAYYVQDAPLVSDGQYDELMGELKALEAGHPALVTPGLRRAVERRDKGCVFAGCGAPTWWCEVHHLLEWLFGGETTLANSALLCERHHTKVHHGFRVERDPGGRWRTWRPDGTEILIS